MVVRRSTRQLIGVILAGFLTLAACASQPTDTPTTTSPAATKTTASPASSAPTSASNSAGPASSTTETAPSSTGQPATVSCDYTASGDSAKPADPPLGTNVAATGTLTATLEMTAGPVVITLDRAKAPCTVHSFESLAIQGFYDDTSCHRLVDQGIFVLQCGDPTGTSTGGPGYRYPDELHGGETYPAGTVAMANSGPNTNGSQFFIVWADSPLEDKFTVFGSIDAQSLNVITTIASRGVSKEASPNPIAEAKIVRISLG